MREKVKRLEKIANVAKRETALPIYLDQDATHFRVRFGFWGGMYPTQTRTATYPIEALDSVIEQTEFYQDVPTVMGIRFVGGDPEELYEVWKGMGVEPGTESWEWRTEAYIRNKGMST